MTTSAYLDYNATTPLAPEVLQTINETLRDAWGNPSSAHRAGLAAAARIRDARASVAAMLNAKAGEIVFCSGGTEANNLVLTGTRGYNYIITSNLEHDSVAKCQDFFAHSSLDGLKTVVVVPANARGFVEPDAVLQAVTEAPEEARILVSIMLANNETGILQPIADIVKTVKRIRENVLFHTDAAQAFGKVKVDVQSLGVDFVTVVGHKFYGPRVGALYIRDFDISPDRLLVPRLFGGGQERGIRPGTENTGMIAGLGVAAQLVADRLEEYAVHMQTMRDYLETQFVARFGAHNIALNGKQDGISRLPNTANISFLLVESNKSLLAPLTNLFVSTGAACHAHGGVSKVLLASGVPEHVASRAVRFSVGRDTTREEIDLAVDLIGDEIEKQNGGQN